MSRELPAAALVALHLAPPAVRAAVTAADLTEVAIGAIYEINDKLLPAHTREHVLAALDLLKVARAELAAGVDAPCRVPQ